MIISWLTGGLGNQMFQYAAGLALAEARRTILKLDVSWFRERHEYEGHNRYALDCFNVGGHFATQREIEQLRGLPLTTVERFSVRFARALHFYQYAQHLSRKGNVYAPVNLGFDPTFTSQPDETYLYGMFQSEEYFASIAQLLRLHFSFRYPPPEQVVKMSGQIASGPSVGMHVRRGDYVRNPSFSQMIGALSQDYYYRAIAIARSKFPTATVYVFSDEIDTVEREMNIPGPTVFVRGSWHAHDNLRLMSLCDHLIIANSTFSWWAAWLNSMPNKTIIAPDPWFVDATKGPDIVPHAWLKITQAQ